MKICKPIAALALLGLGLATQSARAQALSYTAGDVFIGFNFKNTGSSNDLLIDVGQSIFSTAPGATVTVGNYAADLSSGSLYGSTWFTGGNVRWGVIGEARTGDQADTLYAGHPESVSGTVNLNPGLSYAADIANNQASTQTAEESMAGWFATQDVNNASTGNAAIQSISEANSFFNSVQSPAFGQFTGFEGTVAATGGGTSLNFFEIIPTDEGGTGSPLYKGTFALNSSGTVTFTAASVPEPSALMALAGGVGVLAFLRRRRPMMAV